MHRTFRSARQKCQRLCECLRLRNDGQQFVRVEHIHISDGGQAVIGNVKKQNGLAAVSVEELESCFVVRTIVAKLRLFRG